MGKSQEAMALYQDALATKKVLGDVRGIAVTQANIGTFLLQQGDARFGTEILWAAYTTFDSAGYAADAATLRAWLTTLKIRVLGPDHFNALWAEVVGGAQPAWLVDVA